MSEELPQFNTKITIVIIILRYFSHKNAKLENNHYFSKNSKEMEGARDSVKLALPFTAGILSFSCISISIFHTHLVAGLSLVLLCLCGTYTLFNHQANKQVRLLEIAILGCFTGIFIRANNNLHTLTSTEISFLTESAKSFGQALQNWIDSIGFKSHDTNALIKALLTGNRSEIPKHTTEAFRASGASHILALSGLHLGIIYLISSKLLSFVGSSPKARTTQGILCILTCTAYSLATGAGASITRALIFVIIREIAKFLHRKPDLKDILAASLIIHLTIYPSDISNIGFQLSYAAIAGIAWIHPHLKRMWPEDSEPILKRIWDSASISISCQLTTGPLAWFYFGTFPQYFILTNLIALPLTGLIIPAALLTTVLSAMNLCPNLLIQATEMLVNALCNSLEIIATM